MRMFVLQFAGDSNGHFPDQYEPLAVFIAPQEVKFDRLKVSPFIQAIAVAYESRSLANLLLFIHPPRKATRLGSKYNFAHRNISTSMFEREIWSTRLLEDDSWRLFWQRNKLICLCYCCCQSCSATINHYYVWAHFWQSHAAPTIPFNLLLTLQTITFLGERSPTYCPQIRHFANPSIVLLFLTWEMAIKVM